MEPLQQGMKSPSLIFLTRAHSPALSISCYAEHMSRLLVAIQFALILLLVLPFQLALPTVASMVILVAGALLGTWTLLFNRIGNFNIRPEPKDGGRLVTNGPYRYIRHPMYTAVLLSMAAFAFLTDEPLKVFYWVLLLAALWIKSSVEEKMLMGQFPDYASYMQNTGRFLPILPRTRKLP
jgi:protein-S-isoprenylcysteine O-methyltransferase Ste14